VLYGPRAFRVDDQSPVLPELHVNYRHNQYCYKHSYSSIDTSHRPFSAAAATLCGGSWYVLPERIHQRCTVQEPSVLTINGPFSRSCTLTTIDITSTAKAQLFEYRYKPPTLSAAAALCGGSWYTTRKDPPKMHGPRAFRVDDQWPVLPELHVKLST
jgi:hypothetical protein